MLLLTPTFAPVTAEQGGKSNTGANRFCQDSQERSCWPTLSAYGSFSLITLPAKLHKASVPQHVMAATVSATSTFTMQSPVLARIALLMAISMLVSVAAAADECSEHADAQQCYSHHEGCAWCVKDLATKQGVCVPKSEKESSQCVLWDEESCISKLNADECYHYRDSGRKCEFHLPCCFFHMRHFAGPSSLVIPFA